MKFSLVLPRAIIVACFLALSGQGLAQTETDPDTDVDTDVDTTTDTVTVIDTGTLPNPQSAEFLLQYGLRTINAYPAWGDTTGAGVVVAVLDSGVNATHVELAGRIAQGSSLADVDSGGGHGTSVAGVIASNFNGQGIIGVAYNASILALQVTDSNRQAASATAAAGFDLATARSDVRVIAYTAGTVFSEPQNTSIVNAANAGKVVVIRAGNGGQGSPDVPPSVYNNFNGSGIIVGAAHPDGTILDLSNRAGAAAGVYMVAPGIGINAPGNAGNASYVVWTGTSVATPHVAGAAALLLSQNPDLTSQEVVEILFNSATDLGAPGVDPVFGHGMLNAGAAVLAQGDMNSSSDSGGGAGAAVGVAALAVGGGLAYFWSENKKAKKELETTLVFDGYNRPYIMNLNQVLSVQNSAPTLFDIMDMFDRQTRSVGIDLTEDLTFTLHANTSNPEDYVFLRDSDPFLDADDELRDEDLSMKMAGKFNNGFSFNLQHNYAPGSGFDQVGDLSLSENFIWSSSYGAQYMGFGRLSDNMSVGYQPNRQLSFQLGANQSNDGLTHGLSSNAVMMQGSYAPTENTSFSLRVSNLFEDGSLLGGASGGVFSVDSASTTAIGITAKHRIFDKFALFGSFTEGFTSVAEQQGSFLQSVSGMRSQSWGAGIIGSNLFRYHDHAGFAISSPLRVSHGDAELVVPQALDESRNIISSSSQVSLAPEGREIDFEAFYRMNLSHNAQIGTTLTYRDTPEDANYRGEGMSVFTTVGMRF